MTVTATRPATGSEPRSRTSSRVLRRWSWRLFRREWRQQILVVALLALAVAGTVVAGAIATTAPRANSTTLLLRTPGAALAADLAAAQAQFGRISAAETITVPIPGSVSTLSVRSESPVGTFGSTALELLYGSWPNGGGQVAMSPSAESDLGVRVGSTWSEGGRILTVVGTVRNPSDYSDEFALLAPGRITDPTAVTIAVPFTADDVRFPPGSPLHDTDIGVTSTTSASRATAAMVVLLMSTLALTFVGLIATAGFAVMAQRRMRALGMLASVGATDRQVRSVMLANGVLVGAVSSGVGAASGFLAWLLIAPHLAGWVNHSVNRWGLPWWTICGSGALALATAVLAAWWPAKRVARLPIVTALSGRPPRVAPARRPATIGLVAFAAGILLLVLSDGENRLLVIVGVLLALAGLIVIAPLGIRALGRLSRRAPVSARLALRDLVRYESRSAAALRAITLAVAISATISISATRQSSLNSTAVPNLASDQMIVYLSQQGPGGPVPLLDATQLADAVSTIDRVGRDLGTTDVLALDEALNLAHPLPVSGAGHKGSIASGGDTVRATPSAGAPATGGTSSDVYPPAAFVQVQRESGGGLSIMEVSPLYVATPAVLSHYGLAAPAPGVQVITSNHQTQGLQINNGDRDTFTPVVEYADLPVDTSAPNALITQSETALLGLSVEPTAWLIQTPQPLSAAQINQVRRQAAAAGMVVETKASRISLVALGNDMTAGGILLALAVLAMTVGLIRSESARDLRTLTATGASPMTRRALTALTASALAALGALIGVAGAYAGQLAWFHSQLSTLGSVPWMDLALVLIGFPAVAFAGGLAFAGRQPSGVGRQPLD